VRPRRDQFELDHQVAQKTLDVIAEEVGPDKVDITMGYAAATRRSSRSTWLILESGPRRQPAPHRAARGERSRYLRAAGKAAEGGRPEKVEPGWFRGELLRLGLTQEQALERLAGLIFAFERVT